jgi:DNA-binding NtrC family response regulator
MRDEESTATNESWLAHETEGRTRDVLALTIAWSLAEPERVGETVLLARDGARQVLGRGVGSAADRLERAALFRQRPGRLEPRPPLRGKGISRRQLELCARGDELTVERVGRCPISINGLVVEGGVLRPGDTIMLRNQLILICTKRPLMIPSLDACGGCLEVAPELPFGDPDAHGIVGESPAVWELRGQLPFVARRAGHVLVRGPSGAGKELVSRAIHALSSRGLHPFVARNAATIPTGLIDAELFGNIKDYPNAGMRERRGLIGEADGSTLFLDEIGELSGEMQAHLLRVLDADGSYQRLGEDRPRQADLRLVAATNRDLDQLRPEFLARLALRVGIPGLNERREDIPLLSRFLLRRAASKDPDLGRRLFREGDIARGEPRIDPKLMDSLVRHDYAQHVRELERYLWAAMTRSRGQHLALTEELEELFTTANSEAAPSLELTPELIQASLDRHEGQQAKVCAELGLRNRHVLYRLIRKHGLDARKGRASAPPPATGREPPLERSR